MGSDRRLRSLLLGVVALLACVQSCSSLVIESATKQVKLVSFLPFTPVSTPLTKSHHSCHAQIDISTQRVLHSTRIVIKNDGPKTSETEVTLCLPAALHPRAAVLHVGHITDKPTEPAKLQPIGPWATPANGVNDDAVCADFSLSKPLAKGASTELIVECIFTKALHPRPATIRQGDPQLMLYTDVTSIISPYKVLQDVSKINLGTDNMISQTAPSPFTFAGKALTLGPYTNIPPFTSTTFQVHYENIFPTLEAPSVVREITISHWGIVYVEEWYEIALQGAKVIGEWSRYDTMVKTEASKAAAPQFPALIPRSARWIYFRDDIGNISTSKISTRQDSLQVVLTPRFPLFGGWRTKFLFGYSMPLGAAVAHDEKNPSRFMLITAALPAVKDVVIEKLEVRVVLPEGAVNPVVDTQLPHELSSEKIYTYFDVLGRTVVVLKMENVVPDGGSTLTVSYTYQAMILVLKPLLLVVVVVLMALLIGVGLSWGGGGDAAAAAAKLKTN